MGFTVYRKLNSMYIPQSYNSLQETTHGDHGLLWNYFGIFLSLVKKKRFEIWQPIFYFFFQNRERSRVFLFLYSCKKTCQHKQLLTLAIPSFLLCEMQLTTPKQMLLTYTSSHHVSPQSHTITQKLQKLLHWLCFSIIKILFFCCVNCLK